MSIRVMNRVWEQSQHKEGTLLVLLALADYADDNGVCWPAQPEIAKKARLTDRQIRNVLKDLIAEGELLFVPSKGRGRPAVYCVLTGLDQDERTKRHKWFQGKYFQENISAITEERRKLATEKAEIGDRKGGNQLHTKYHEKGASESAETTVVENDNRHRSVIDPSKSVRVEPDDFTRALADLCAVNLQLLKRTPKDRAAFKDAYTGLREIGATVEQVGTFNAYWYSDSNWITRKARQDNRKPEPPRPDQVLTEWSKAMAQAPKRVQAGVTSVAVQPARKQMSGAEVREVMKRLEAGK